MTQDYWVFQTEEVVLAKFVIIGLIHSLLCFVVAEGGFRQNRNRILFLPRLWLNKIVPALGHRIAVSAGAGMLVAVLSWTAMHFSSIGTMMIANAAFLTFWYVECAILLSKGFFHRLFGDEIPSEITLFISFVVMVNAGYFTLMFLVSVLRAPSL